MDAHDSGTTSSDAASVNLDHGDWFEESIPLHQHSLYRKIDRVLAPMPPGAVLELGPGKGRYLNLLQSRGWEVLGLELQPQAADYILQHDLSEPFPVNDGQFDVVVAAEVIEHIVDTRQFLARVAAALKPGGVLVLTTPNLLFGVNRLRMLVGRRPWFVYADFHVRFFVWDDLREKLGEDFVVEALGGSHVLVGVRHGRAFEVFSRLADRFPTLAAHFVVVARRRD